MSLKNPQPSPVTPSLIISKLESIITDMECPICLSVIENTHVVPNCGHRFCGDCIKKSLRTCNNECPSCRIPVKTKRSLREDDLFDHLVSFVFASSFSSPFENKLILILCTLCILCVYHLLFVDTKTILYHTRMLR